MNLYVAKKKKSARREISAETTAPTFRAPRVFSSSNTRAHESRKLSLVQSSSSTDHSHLQWCGCHPFPILSPARVFSSSPLPSGIASCRSKSEFGLSSPHHQSGNLSAKFCRTDYILSPPHLSLFALSRKGRSFCVLPHKYLEPCLLLVWPWCEISMWASTNWMVAPIPFSFLQEAFFLDPCLPLPGTLWSELVLVLN
jgi:hypothetical protein